MRIEAGCDGLPPGAPPGLLRARPGEAPGRRAWGAWPGWVPLVSAPLAVLLLGGRLPAWGLMWALSGAICAGLKWLTWWGACKAGARAPVWRSLGYLCAWPGMDAVAFMTGRPRRTGRGEWVGAIVKTGFGALTFWGAARFMPAQSPLLRGWVGLLGLIFLLHFGSFHLLSLLWRAAGVDAGPIMVDPGRAASLSEFWGRRWNLAFHLLTRDFLLRPLRGRIGARAATLAAFLASGLVHDAVISVPAGGGYGLPTAYFVLQGLGVLLERSALGSHLRLRRGPLARLFAVVIAAGPVFWLFHPPFVIHVVLPFMRAAGAL